MIRVRTVADLRPGDHWLGDDRGRIATVEHRGDTVRVTFHGRPATEDYPATTEAVVRVTSDPAGAHP